MRVIKLTLCKKIIFLIKNLYKSRLIINYNGIISGMIYDSEKLIKFGKNVAKYRKAKYLSQNALAELLGISREHLAKIETAKRGIGIELLFKLAEVLEIEEKQLFEF